MERQETGTLEEENRGIMEDWNTGRMGDQEGFKQLRSKRIKFRVTGFELG
jgi:hypothetical protein